MKLYHYAPRENSVLKDGLFSISKIDRNLRPYAHRAGSENKEDILKWLDSTFYGRSRAISCLTEPIKHEGNDPVLKKIVDGSELFSFELNDLIKDGVVETMGIPVYLVNDYLLNKYNLEVNTTYVGTSLEFLEFVRQLPEIK